MPYSQSLGLILAVCLKIHFSECVFRCNITPGDRSLTKHPFRVNAVLNCSFFGNNVDAVNWTRNEQPLEEGKILADPQINKRWSAVILGNATRHQNAGKFTCTARRVQEVFSCSVRPGKPNLQKLESVKIVEYGRSPKMTCRASGWPTPRVSWWKNGSQVQHGDKMNSYWLERVTNSMLSMEIFDIEGFHHGTYTCRADNMFGTSVEEINVMVKRSDMIQNRYDQKLPIVALEGRNATLECVCDKHECKEKTATAYWKFEGNYVNRSERVRLSKVFLASGVRMLMTILNAARTDHGEYVCGINTSLGFGERQRRLHVLTKDNSPQVLAASKDVFANPQSPAWLKCNAVYPAVLTELETFWTFNDTLIPKNSEHHQQERFGPRNGANSTTTVPFELHISNVSLADFGRYSCGVKFKVGVARTNISLSLKENPENGDDEKQSGTGSKETPVVAISSITAGGIIMGFVVAFVAYRLCRNKRKTDEPFFETPVNGRQFRYDVFVTFSSQDLNWVRKELIPLVEKHKLNYCIHDKDFVIGKPVVDNMAESVYTSRKVLAVMSHNYMSSKFCRDELEMALYRSTEMGDSSVIVMRIDGVDRSKLPKALRNRTFLDYYDFTERKNWEERLIKHLKPPPIDKCSEKSSEKLYTLLKDSEV